MTVTQPLNLATSLALSSAPQFLHQRPSAIQVREPGVGGGEAEIVRFGAQSTLGYRKPGLLLLVNRRDLRLERASKQVEGKRGTERCMRNRLDEALPSFPCPEKVELAPFLGCRSRSGWKGSKTVPTEAFGCTIDACQESKTEILVNKGENRMEEITHSLSTGRYPNETSVRNESHSSGVSWAAVIGGAFVTAALSLILLALGTGLGFSSVSPWSNVGASASTVGTAAIVWLILMQIMSSSMGGYLAGRLRTKWADIHTDELYFRDTAHGFLAWAVALVITAAFLASAATSMMGAAAQLSATASSAGAERELNPNEYFVDALFRSDSARADSNGASVRGEAGRIFANALRQGYVPPADKSYLAQLVASKTGLGKTDAEKRVSDVFAEAQQGADTARKTIAHSLLWTFLALLIGAFCASFAATIGGRQRDHVVMV